MKINNGYADKSGKGTITFNENGRLRVHWGCGCCDYWNDEADTPEMRLAEIIVKILNKPENKKIIEKWEKQFHGKEAKT